MSPMRNNRSGDVGAVSGSDSGASKVVPTTPDSGPSGVVPGTSGSGPSGVVSPTSPPMHMGKRNSEKAAENKSTRDMEKRLLELRNCNAALEDNISSLQKELATLEDMVGENQSGHQLDENEFSTILRDSKKNP